jgi:hypothetical protein
VDCKQLQEILELPPNIEEYMLKDVFHWKVFQKYQKNINSIQASYKRCIGLTCPECYKMLVNIQNHWWQILYWMQGMSLSLSLSLSVCLCMPWFMGYIAENS